jgi:predicted ATPase/DNA-binding SARP family transcriptional activator
MESPWRIQMLGELRATQGDQVLTRFRTHKTGLLLAYLAYHRRSYPREELIELLWPECDPKAGRNNLRVALSSLRQQLELPRAETLSRTVLEADHAVVRLNSGAFTTDVMAFEAALTAVHDRGRPLSHEQQVERLTEAAGLYQGELLPGCFEPWIMPARQRLAEAYRQGLRQLSALLEQEGDLGTAIRWARRAVCADPLAEEPQEYLIRLLAAAGDRDGALQQYRDLERLLGQEWGVAPGPDLRSLARSLQHQGAVPGAGRPTTAPRDPPGLALSKKAGRDPGSAGGRRATGRSRDGGVLGATPAGRLPRQFTRFFGREEEIARLCEMLAGTVASDVGGDISDSGLLADPDPFQIPNAQNRGPARSHLRRVPGAAVSPPPPEIQDCLVTLTGPGGAGKTRLALAVAERLQEASRGRMSAPTDGRRLECWFVPLQDLTDSRLIMDRVRAVLPLTRSTRTEPLRQVVVFLSQHPSLLILDNFEHLISGGALILHALREQVPALACLVTSRRRLGLAGEQDFPVAPLPVPVGGGQWAVGRKTRSADVGLPTSHYPLPALLQCPSVALFLDRARAVRPDFELIESNAAVVAALCRQLEGLPLAIELAAARAGVLAPAQMLARLSATHGAAAARFELLATRQRNVAPRHRSLRATLDWSYRLLPTELQQFFARFSIFRGGFTLEAAEAVCGDEGIQVFGYSGVQEGAVLAPEHLNTRTPEYLTLDGLDQLQECSLVLASPGAEHRFSLLEAVREYAAEQLSSGEQAMLARRHACYYLQLAEAVEPELTGPDQGPLLERLDQEHDNLRAALDWCGKAVGSGQWAVGSPAEPGSKNSLPLPELPTAHCPLPTAVAIGLRLGGALGGFWRARCYLAEGRERLGQLLALPGAEAPTAIRAKALRWTGFLAHDAHDLESARGCFQESLAICREQGALPEAAEALIGLGAVAESQDNYDAARPRYEESLAISRHLGSKRGMAHALYHLCEVAREQGDLETAAALARQSQGLHQEIGNGRGAVEARNRLAIILHHQGDHAAARALLEESLAAARQLGDKRDIAWALICLGDVSRCLGEYESAAGVYQESLDLWREIGDEWPIAGMLNAVGITAVRRGDPARAMALIRESIARYESLGREEASSGPVHGLAIRFTAICLVGVAAVAAAVGQPERAGRLMGAAGAALAAVGARLWPAERADFERTLQAVRDQLGEAAFAAARAAGAALPLDQAVTEALALPLAD